MQIRDYRPADRDAVLALAVRLTEGVAAWRDPDDVRAAAEGWVRDALDGAGDPDRCVLVAVDDDDSGDDGDGEVAGFVGIGEQAHWSGGADAYIGELVVAPRAERRGVGRQLVRAAEAWARHRGHRRVTLETGAANTPARRFYADLGYVEEQVQLTRLLDAEEPS